MIEIHREREEELLSRQEQFATIFPNGDPEKLRGLKFCHVCRGADYVWTDYSLSDIDVEGLDIKSSEENKDYRHYLMTTMCEDCDGTGFEGGNSNLTLEEWIALSDSNKKKF